MGSFIHLQLTQWHHEPSPAHCARNTRLASTLSRAQINTFSASRWTLCFSHGLKFSRHGFPMLKQLGRDLNGAITLPTAGRGNSSGTGCRDQVNPVRLLALFTLSMFHPHFPRSMLCIIALCLHFFSLVTGNPYPSRFSPRASSPPVFVKATIKPLRQ